MKRTFIGSLLCITFMICLSCHQKDNPLINRNGRILNVPAEYSTIEMAVKNSAEGDWIILAPGNHFGQKIDVDKAVTISSEWKISGDETKIEETVIDSGDSILFNIMADSVEISGLKIVNGDHPLNITANVKIKHNHFVNNLDAMSFEGSAGGYAGYNTVENDRDDGMDLDIRLGGKEHGSDILIENNTIINCHDDGIEIRLYDYPDQNIKYTIRNNRISGSTKAGIQIISYDIFTGKSFQIHHNIIAGCKTGLGCMEGSNTREDMSGASKMDEQILFYNNTLVNNQMGATGGNNIIALNNLVLGNAVGGFKRFGSKSVIINNLFFLNGSDLIEINDSAVRSGNIQGIDPLIDKSNFTPAGNSPCIDAGKVSFDLNGTELLKVSAEDFTGIAPDIGAIEVKNRSK